MKKIFVLVVLLAISTGAWWWHTWNTDAPTAPEKTVATAPAPMPKVAATTSIQAPVLAPKPAPSATTATPSAPVKALAEDTSSGGTGNVKTAVTDLIGLIEAGDKSGYLEKKMFPPQGLDDAYQNIVEVFTKMNQQNAPKGQPTIPIPTFADWQVTLKKTIDDQVQRGGPDVQRMMDEDLTVLKSIESSTPTLNDAGDEAVYTLDPAVSASISKNPKTMSFHIDAKDGQWYYGPKPKR